MKNYGVSVKKALAFPLLVISIKSPNGTYDNNFLSNYATININDNIARIQGVGQINLFGGSDYAMRVWLRPDRVAKLGITVPDIVNAINQQNQLSPAGQIGGPPAQPGTEYTYTVRTQGRLLDEAEFGDIIVRSNPDGSQVRLKDVARLELGTQLYNALGRHDGKPSAVIAVFQIPGTNALQVANEIKKTMEDLKTRFPADLDYTVSLDTTLPVTEGINEIVHTLVEAVVLVIIVVFVFLQNWRATLIPLLTVPVSLVGAFMFFPLLGFSINVLSLLGLVLAIGIVVDDAIVVVEAVMHHIEHGHGAEGGHAQGDGGGVRAGRRDRAHPDGRVRAGRVHGRHHRPALSAVRDHDCDLGAAVGRQRADAVARAGGDAAEAADGQADAAHALLQRVQPGLRQGDQRLHQLHDDPRAQVRRRSRAHRRPDRGRPSGS